MTPDTLITVLSHFAMFMLGLCAGCILVAYLTGRPDTDPGEPRWGEWLPPAAWRERWTVIDGGRQDDKDRAA